MSDLAVLEAMVQFADARETVRANDTTLATAKDLLRRAAVYVPHSNEALRQKIHTFLEMNV